MSLRAAQHEQALAADRGLLVQYAGLDAAGLLAHMRTRSGVRYFPVADVEETRPEKIAAIMNDRFEFNGETHVLTEPLDWLSNPSQDVEWHILLHKFYYAVGLGMAYRASGDPRYLVRWMSLTTSWIEQTPLGFIAADVTGRRVQNWIYAYYYFVAQAPAAPICPQFHERFLGSLRDQVNFLCENLTPGRNHRTLELYAIFLASVVFPEFLEAQRWRELSIAELTNNIQSDLLPDGVHIELSTDYHHLVLKNFLNVRRLARLNNIAMPAVFDSRLVQGLEFSMHAHKPDGIVPSLSDGDARGFLDLLQQGAELYDRDDMRYVATRGAAGSAPDERARAFADSGYCVLRSGWGQAARGFADEQYLIFDCGPIGAGNHGHLDCLSFELAAYGRSLVVDPGRYTYSEAGETNWRVVFRGTAYHNTVTVDGRNQTRYEPRIVKEVSRHKQGSTRHRIAGPAPEARLLQFEARPGFDMVCGEARSAEYEALHRRHIAFVFDEYWLVCDELRAGEMHEYDQRFHLAPEAQGQVQCARERGTWLVHSPNLLLAHEDVGEVQLQIDPGFVSYKYGEKHAAPVVRLNQRADNARFHTLLYPHRGDAPRIAIRALHPNRSDANDVGAAKVCALRVTVGTGEEMRTDYFAYAEPARATWHIGNYLFRGSFLALREDAYGEVIALHAAEDAVIYEDGRLLHRGRLAC
jgi:hypothetical protein